MLQRFKNWWVSFHASFHDSETILWARAKAAAGAVLLVSTQFDMSQIITDPRWLFVWKAASVFLLADGGFSEYVRRRRAGDLYDNDDKNGKAQ